MHIFAVNWEPKENENSDKARSIHWYYINYAVIPVIFKPRLKTEITLSITESEYTGLIYDLCDTIPIIKLLKEMKDSGLQTSLTK